MLCYFLLCICDFWVGAPKREDRYFVTAHHIIIIFVIIIIVIIFVCRTTSDTRSTTVGSPNNDQDPGVGACVGADKPLYSLHIALCSGHALMLHSFEQY